MNLSLLIFTGLPASGKSTYYRTHFSSYAHVSKDDFPSAHNKDKRQRELIEKAFKEGRSVVVDNTNPSVEVRRPLIELAKASGALCIGYYFTANVGTCRARNRLREDAKAIVPDVAIYTIASRLEPPTFEEGFDVLYEVGPNGEVLKEEGLA